MTCWAPITETVVREPRAKSLQRSNGNGSDGK